MHYFQGKHILDWQTLAQFHYYYQTWFYFILPHEDSLTLIISETFIPWLCFQHRLKKNQHIKLIKKFKDSVLSEVNYEYNYNWQHFNCLCQQRFHKH